MFVVLIYFVYLLANNEHHMVNTEQNHSLNRLKIVLVEQGKSGRWWRIRTKLTPSIRS